MRDSSVVIVGTGVAEFNGWRLQNSPVFKKLPSVMGVEPIVQQILFLPLKMKLEIVRSSSRI